MKILIISLAGAGDLLMATPLIKEIKLNYPTSKLDLLVMQGDITKDLVKNNPYINSIIYFNFIKEGLIRSLLFCKKLRKEKYDISITTYPQARYPYSIISFLIGAKKRVGFIYESQKIKLNKLFFTHTLKEDFSKHVVYNNLNVLVPLGLKQKTKNPHIILNLDKENIKFSEDFFKKNKIKKAVVLHAGSGTTKNFILKRWPKENFAELAKKIFHEKGYKVILVGGKEENSLKEEIIKLSTLEKDKNIFNLNTDILNIAAIIKKCDYVVSNDTVISHIAAALNKKVICLFGPTDYINTGPFTKNKIIICKRPKDIPSFKHGKRIPKKLAKYMDLITVKEVFDKIK